MGNPNDPWAQNQPQYGQNQPPYGQDQSQWGQNQPPQYGQDQPPYGQDQSQYGQPQYGQGQPDYGQYQGNQYQGGQYQPYADPYGGYPQQPGQYPPPTPPRKSRTPIIVAIAVAAVILIAVAITVPLLLWKSDDEPGGQADAEQEPPTASATQLIVDESDFDGFDDFESNNGVGTETTADATPSECDFLAAFVRPSDVEYATVSWLSEGGLLPGAFVYVEKWADDKLETQEQVIEDTCSLFSYVFDDDPAGTEPTEAEFEVVQAEGADAPTVASEQVFIIPDGGEWTYRWYETVVRGTTVRVGFGFDDTWSDSEETEAIELLNKQIKKIRDAE